MTNELIYKTETDLQISQTNLRLPKRKHRGGQWGRDKSGAWEEHTHATIYKIDSQQGPTVEHRELCLIFSDNLYEKRI